MFIAAETVSRFSSESLCRVATVLRRGFTPHSAAMHLYGDHPHREAPLYTIQQQRGQGSSIGAVQHVYF